MNRGLTISCIGHAAALALALIAISAQPMQSPPVESLPVQFISDKDFTQMIQGVKNPPKLKVDNPKPIADKVDAPKPVQQLAPKVADKPEITTDSAASKPQPKPETKPDPKPETKSQAKADPKPSDRPDKSKPDLKLDQIADLLKKDNDKKVQKSDQKPAPDTPPRDSPKFNADQVAALLDKRDPRREVATAATLNDTPNLGAATGPAAAQLSQSEIDALKARISQCWNPPAGVESSTKIYVVLRVLFKSDGSLAHDPVLVEGSAASLGPALAESAMRALLRCQPFTMLRPEHYEQWKDIELKFDPHELLGG